MSSRAISGRPGGGKSYYAVKLLLRELLESERSIVTNLPLRLDNILKYCLNHKRDDIDVYSRIQILEDDQVPEFWRYRGNAVEPLPACSNEDWKAGRIPAFDQVKAPVCYFLDEVHDFLNSRNWRKTGDACLFYISKHRHLGDDVFWITQAVKNVDSQFRSVTQDYTYCRNYAKERFRGFSKGKYFTAVTFLEPISMSATSQADPQTQEKYVMEKEIGDCYYTSKQKLAADTGQCAKGMSIKWVFFGIGLLCLLAIAATYYGPRAIVGLITHTSGGTSLAGKGSGEKKKDLHPGSGAPLSTPDLTGKPEKKADEKKEPPAILAVPLQGITGAEVLEAMKNQGSSLPPNVQIFASPFGSGIVIYGPDLATVTCVSQCVKAIDSEKSSSVIVEAVVLRRTVGKSSTVGVWEALQAVVAAGGLGSAKISYDPIAGLMTFGTVTFAQEAIRMLGTQVVRKYGFNVESRPLLSMTSGKTAWFASGKEVPVPVTTQNTIGNQNSINYKKVQFSFGVTAAVMPSGRIVLDIEQANDDVIGTAQVGGNAVPTLATQSLTTRLELVPGQLAVLGGIEVENKGDDARGFPVLGAFPPLSWIFGTRDKTGEKSQLVIALTARVVPSGENASPVRKAEKTASKKSGVKRGNVRPSLRSR